MTWQRRWYLGIFLGLTLACSQRTSLPVLPQEPPPEPDRAGQTSIHVFSTGEAVAEARLTQLRKSLGERPLSFVIEDANGFESQAHMAALGLVGPGLVVRDPAGRPLWRCDLYQLDPPAFLAQLDSLLPPPASDL